MVITNAAEIDISYIIEMNVSNLICSITDTQATANTANATTRNAEENSGYILILFLSSLCGINAHTIGQTNRNPHHGEHLIIKATIAPTIMHITNMSA